MRLRPDPVHRSTDHATRASYADKPALKSTSSQCAHPPRTQNRARLMAGKRNQGSKNEPKTSSPGETVLKQRPSVTWSPRAVAPLAWKALAPRGRCRSGARSSVSRRNQPSPFTHTLRPPLPYCAPPRLWLLPNPRHNAEHPPRSLAAQRLQSPTRRCSLPRTPSYRRSGPA